MTRAQLTQREDEVLHLAVTGLSNDEIAARLAISRRTVEAHMRTLFRKIGVTRRAQLAALYQGGDPAIAEPSEPVGGPATQLCPPGHGLADYRRQLQVYAAAMRGLVDRQFPLFEERVEISVLIGEQDGQDTVVERRWTRPRPYLVYRILAPIVNWSDGSSELDDLALVCQVDGEDTHVEVHPVRDVDGRPLVMILFQPGLQAETEWVLRYRSPQLWNPLRSSGEDTLSWATATLDQRHPPTTTELTLKVVFPASWTGEQVVEQSNLGVVHTERLPTGRTQVSWHHENPDAGMYHWALRGSPGA
ncbi:MAG: helix-turn-helix domain-containing protein [Pseudonocardiaceae bacterium]